MKPGEVRVCAEFDPRLGITWDTSRQTGRVESMRMSRRLEMEIASVSVCTRSGRFSKDRLS